MQIHRCSILAAAAAAALVTPYGNSVEARELEEIVVTAERRAENLREVPSAITALGESTIEQPTFTTSPTSQRAFQA